MKRPRYVQLLQVEAAPQDFSPLVAAARDAGLRVGWLTLGATEPPRDLEEAAATGVLRAVAVGAGRAVSVKPVAGPPILGDLVREHFAGCRLILVSGAAEWLEAQTLAPDARGGWMVGGAGRGRRFTTEEIVRRLRSPHLLRQVPLKQPQ